MHVYVYIYIYVCVCVNIYMCVHMCIYIYMILFYYCYCHTVNWVTFPLYYIKTNIKVRTIFGAYTEQLLRPVLQGENTVLSSNLYTVIHSEIAKKTQTILQVFSSLEKPYGWSQTRMEMIPNLTPIIYMENVKYSLTPSNICKRTKASFCHIH